jgi:NitT/TauT family transport system permease protein
MQAVNSPSAPSPASQAVAGTQADAALAPSPQRRFYWGTLLPVAASALAWLVHACVPNRAAPAGDPLFANALLLVCALSFIATILAWLWPIARAWVRHNGPLFAVAYLSIALWDLFTLKLARLSPLYFPGPDRVVQAMHQDWLLLLDCLYHSLVLLLAGYFVGTAVGLVCGILIGYWPRVRYWGMPLLKIIGPIPAMAWLPVVLQLFAPSSFLPAMSIVALAVWFPVTMLTASGVANVRVSYLDVARTLGAGRVFLIFHVVIPAAMPSIFLGLFMGLGASFLSLIAAEMLGVKSGLGWYWSGARESMEYSKVYAALALMALFFWLIMSGLFHLRDRVLVWQKGVIKW